MGVVKAVALWLMLFAATPIAADPLARWQPQIAEASARFGVPVPWIERVMRAESAGQTLLDGRPTTSRAGAVGLMQVMPASWMEMRAANSLGDDPYNPRDNILAGTAYLRAMYDRFGYPGLFAAYNAGPGRYAEHLASGRTLPTETRAYLAKLSGSDPAIAQRHAPRPQSNLFIALRRDASEPAGTPSPAEGSARDPLFAVRASR